MLEELGSIGPSTLELFSSFLHLIYAAVDSPHRTITFANLQDLCPAFSSGR
jgi:hypothetical protein